MGRRLDLRELNRTTLGRQLLLARADGPVTDVIGAVGGLQAQHARMPFVALHARRTGDTVADLDAAVLSCRVVKATVMRSTLHLVPAANLPVLDAVAAEQRVATWAPSARRAGLDLVALNAAVREHCRAPRTVDEIEAFAASLHPGVDAAAAIPGGVSRAWWRLASAAGGLVQVPPAGTWDARGTPRYGDATAWASVDAVGQPEVGLDEARARAVAGYLRAFGPATVADVGRGLGLRRVGQVKRALGELDLATYDGPDGETLVDDARLGTLPGDAAAPVRFLPRWEQLLVALDGRDRIVVPEHVPAVYKRNADVLPTFLVDGFVAGTWAVEGSGDRAELVLAPFGTVAARDRAAAEEEGEALLRLLVPAATARSVRWS
ncbi:winged helix DNA-binding domain-containing protein [Antribacter gilvus]|uniref:winged helix DNA-binding domain-containing protein n=1 Tax=Antribacter gilvus TaxID=2304675 RepID=UPI000F77FD47|nr:winged helix DNA-binding domain-containing protein [Antribacter gilvus]